MIKSLTINNYDFAQTEQTLVGEFNVFDLPRLADLLIAQDQITSKGSAASYTLQGVKSVMSNPQLHLTLDAVLPMQCQRCLAPMHLAVHLFIKYEISDVELNEMDDVDDMDWLEPEINMDVYRLIEDELLVAIPFAPKHEQACKSAQMESGEKPNPFVALKSLLKT